MHRNRRILGVTAFVRGLRSTFMVRRLRQLSGGEKTSGAPGAGAAMVSWASDSSHGDRSGGPTSPGSPVECAYCGRENIPSGIFGDNGTTWGVGAMCIHCMFGQYALVQMRRLRRRANAFNCLCQPKASGGVPIAAHVLLDSDLAVRVCRFLIPV